MKIIRFLKYYVLRLMSLFFGPFLARKIIKNNFDTQMVMTCPAIGDQCFALAYLRAYQRENGFRKIGFITYNKESNKALLEYFSGQFDKGIVISKLSFFLIWYGAFPGGFLFKHCSDEKYSKIFFPDVMGNARFNISAHNKLGIAYIEKLMYKIPQNTKACEVKVDNTRLSQFLSMLDDTDVLIQRMRTVIINPYANTVCGVPLEFFDEISVAISKRGFSVITSTIGEQRALKNSIGLNFPLEVSIELSNFCGYVIGLRSGFLDLQTFSKARIVSIDSKNYNLTDCLQLEKAWPDNKNCKSFVYDKNESEKLVGKIVDWLLPKE